MAVLSQTRTFPSRLKAGLLPGWSIAHKTGTGGTLDGITSAANDVGMLMAPDGSRIAVAVFVSRTARPDVEQDAFMASLARAVCESYRPD
jgi:beta-lactamase class A